MSPEKKTYIQSELSSPLSSRYTLEAEKEGLKARYAGSLSQSKREELWEDLLEERGPIFADHRVKEFVDDLIQYKKIKGDGVDLGGEIDLIARRGEEILLVEVKSQTLDSYQCRYGRWNLRENMV